IRTYAPQSPGLGEGGAGVGAAAASAGAGCGRALRLTCCSQLTSQPVQPVPGSSRTSVPLTTTRSPSLVTENSHAALLGDRLTQPCDTLRRPWSYTDHGAEWMYSPPQVSRIANSTGTR